MGTLAEELRGWRGHRRMKYLDEFRTLTWPALFDDIVRRPRGRGPSWKCGGQTHSNIRHGIDQLLPDQIELIHGLRCPVCVTPLRSSTRLWPTPLPEVIFCSFGDSCASRGSGQISGVKSAGGDVRIVYSPLDASSWRSSIRTGRSSSSASASRPLLANAMAVFQARQLGAAQLLHACLPRARAAGHRRHYGVARQPQAFLAAGHVCSVMGTWEYEPLVARYHVPIVVTGFEPLDVLEGIRRTVAQAGSRARCWRTPIPRRAPRRQRPCAENG
ncbi:MAG: hypothetical protein R3A10_01285 [Caldilineaceae bacterium]